MDQILFGFILPILIMLFATDVMLYHSNAWVQGRCRRVIRWGLNQARRGLNHLLRMAGRVLLRLARAVGREIIRFVRFAWTHHRGVFLGAIAGLLSGVLVGLYIIGRLS